MKRNSFSVFFFIKRTRLLDNGEAPIRLRIKVNGIMAESQIKRSVRLDLWDQPTETCKGRDQKSAEINEYIRMLKLKVLTIHRELELSGAHFTARLIMNKLYNAEEKQTILSIFQKHNDDIRQLIGINYEKRTVSRYDSCRQYLADMIKRQYGKDDMTLVEVDGELIRNYEMHLKLIRGCQQNTIIRYMKCFKKVIHIALSDGVIQKDPFLGIRFTAKEVVKDVLTKDELETLINRKFRIKRLEHVRDVFIFCCLTGLAYIDAHNLQQEDIERDNHGDLWIRKTRQKTNVEFHVPLLEIPQMILKKYNDDPDCQRTGLLFPITSNQKMNDYLKEIAELCSIKKHLTTHLARHTFATLMLNNGVSIESLSRMMGHNSLKSTLVYARVTDHKINEEMNIVARKLN